LKKVYSPFSGQKIEFLII